MDVEESESQADKAEAGTTQTGESQMSGKAQAGESQDGKSQMGKAQVGESEAGKAVPKTQVPWRALTFAVVAVVVGLGAGFLMLQLADSGGVDVRLGDAEFSAGAAQQLSEDIAERGPILYPDPRGSSRHIYIQHQGEDFTRGWLAFEPHWPGTPRECILAWEAVSGQFVPPDNLPCESLPRAEADGTAVVDSAGMESTAIAETDAEESDLVYDREGAAGAIETEETSETNIPNTAISEATRLPQHRIAVTPSGRVIVTLQRDGG